MGKDGVLACIVRNLEISFSRRIEQYEEPPMELEEGNHWEWEWEWDLGQELQWFPFVCRIYHGIMICVSKIINPWRCDIIFCRLCEEEQGAGG